MVRKIVVSPSILSHHTTVVGPEGTIAYFIFPYSGRIGKGRIRIKQKEGNKTIVALVAYTSIKGVVTNYKDAFDKNGEATFPDYYEVEEGGCLRISLLFEMGGFVDEGIIEAAVSCGFLPTPVPEMVLVIGQEDASG